jgi:hypothetical protein
MKILVRHNFREKDRQLLSAAPQDPRRELLHLSAVHENSSKAQF